MYDMCMCANFYKYHNKSMTLQRLLSALVLGQGWIWLVVLLLRGLGLNKNESTLSCSLATPQHLCSTLVGLINPGLVGVSLKRKITSYEYADEVTPALKRNLSKTHLLN